jgi:hypothetical protein
MGMNAVHFDSFSLDARHLFQKLVLFFLMRSYNLCMCFHISCVGIDNELFCTLIKQNKISSWSCSFCAVKSSTESLSDSPLTSNKDQCENQTITISTVELKNLITSTLDEQIMPLTAHISQL